MGSNDVAEPLSAQLRAWGNPSVHGTVVPFTHFADWAAEAARLEVKAAKAEADRDAWRAVAGQLAEAISGRLDAAVALAKHAGIHADVDSHPVWGPLAKALAAFKAKVAAKVP